MRLNFYIAPLLAILCATAQATPAPDSAQLRVEGAITQPNYQQDALWDTAMLDQLPEYEIKTHTPWYDEEKTFRGPRLSDLLAKVGASGKQLTITALNDYSIQVPTSDAAQYQVILARSINGKPLSVRDKGPLFLIYPFDQYPELRNKLYYSRAIWQINKIKVE
ncbi:molybdopterin-dependent oxidoreductase [Aeromonas hydrophila]|nr:molybdopterin-dependent oxidoreductase [Aeromonas hydrophila]AKA17775.1 molybdopterin-binding protein [Aeromonas hydrophila]KER63256.1 molybdopterin-binding protein [Aeromonas hydrophila]KWR68610.1 molybdopterin-binding protein [Aeromonas hydrophila]MBW3797418.1 molybdopterin-dependent oxidoreductase [Aeromonas hydrophila]MBW3799462.1 molybdopterin-dependent oxidoreductase [Aeromonas hydrophila]